MPQSSYYKNNRPTPALDRARRQYLIPNMITGACIVSIVVGIYFMTMKLVSQDEFEDVPIPDGPRDGATANVGTGALGGVGVQGVAPQGGVAPASVGR